MVLINLYRGSHCTDCARYAFDWGLTISNSYIDTHMIIDGEMYYEE
jgi:hypothetical protein